MDNITTTIKREFLEKIVAGEKKVEYRENKPYWQKRLGRVSAPFSMRLINGMTTQAPEVTVLIDRVREVKGKRRFVLRIATVLSYKNWDKRRRCPR
jgi:hypothetical protein